MFNAIGLSSAATVATIGFGAGTNKILAVVAGQEGVALLGLYRTLTAIAVQIVAMGAAMVIVREISTSKSADETSERARTAITFGVMQSTVLLLVAAFASPLVARALFGADFAPHVLETRLALAMAVGVLAMQVVLAVLNGLRRLTDALWVNLITSAGTLAVSYWLVQRGPIGIVLLLGSTCFVGAAIGLIFVIRAAPLRGSTVLRRPTRDFFRSLPVSGALTLQPFVVLGTTLFVQSRIAQHFGLDQLGLFAAASTLEGTSLMVLTAGMTSYFLPTLGIAQHAGERDSLFNETLGLLVPLAVLGVTILAGAAPQILGFLFSARFVGASQLTGILGVSIIAQAYVWCYGLVLVNRGHLRTHVALATLESLVRLTGSIVCIALELPLLSLGLVHLGSCVLAAVGYAAVDRRTRGHSVVSRSNRWLTLAASLTGALILVLANLTAPIPRFLLASTLATAWLAFFILQNSKRNPLPPSPGPGPT